MTGPLTAELRRVAAHSRHYCSFLAADLNDAAAERIDQAAALLDRIHHACTSSDLPDLTGLLADIAHWLATGGAS